MRNRWVLKAMLAVAVTVVTASGANASVIFSDDFESDPLGLGQTTLSQWTVSPGSVDIVGTTFFGGLCDPVSGSSPSPAHCVDLDGSTVQAGTMSTASMSFGVGTYDLSFWLAGNQRGYLGFGNDTVIVTLALGPVYSETFTLGPSSPWQQINRPINFSAPTTGQLTFNALGGDNVGLLLDNVLLQDRNAVPEPMTLTLLGSGLAGLIARRRRART